MGRIEENRQEIHARLSHLENIRILLEEARVHGRNMSSSEGDRIEVQIRTTLMETNRQIHDVRASLPQRIRMLAMNGMEDGAMRLLQATREQLHGKPTRQVEPCEVAEKAGINPYSQEYETIVRYLLDHGYMEPYPNSDFGSLGFYRVTNKGLEEILSSPQLSYEERVGLLIFQGSKLVKTGPCAACGL